MIKIDRRMKPRNIRHLSACLWGIVLIGLLAACGSVRRSTPATATLQEDRGIVRDTLSPEQQRKYDYFYLEAMRMKMQRKYDAAFDLLQHCLRISPHASSALYEVAQYYVALKQPERGEALLEQAVRYAPDNYWYAQGLVNLYLQQQEPDKAIALLEDMTVRFPDKLDPLYSLLDLYKGITKDQLRENMRYFLSAIMPTCDEYDMRMCVHPDDPPFPILGLPRIVTCDDDIRWFLDAVDNPHNGLTFCAGSLSAGAHNNVVELARKYASRTWFVHLRSCHVFPNGDFTEASHLGGRADVIELARIFEKANPSLPMRVDHGMTMLGDADRGYNAGYTFLGRMFAMGQVQGILAAVDRELGISQE